MDNPLRQLKALGQSVWLDDIGRDLLAGGGLARLIADDGLAGVTSNPSIFAHAVAASDAYTEQLTDLLAADPELPTARLYEALVVGDIRAAADVLRPVYEATGGDDGYVSLEVSPHLADDSDGTVAEAQHLWVTVDRRNLMIKVPATAAGIPAIEELLAAGINVNATLIFSLQQYDAVARAYLRGAARCPEPRRLASVASFFVSRLDTVVDRELERLATPAARALAGRAAVANARLAYRRFAELFHGAPFAALAAQGVRVQRPLWASTSTKNPAYSDVLYVEELIGAETVNTLPRATLEAFRDHGRARPTLAEGGDQAAAALTELRALGVDLDGLTDRLLIDGVAAFARSFDELLATVEACRARVAAC